MDNLGDLLGGLGEMFGIFGESAGEGAGEGLAALLRPGGQREGEALPVVYARFLCGGPRELHINDR